MGYITLSDGDIAMMEHDIIGNNEVLDWRSEDARWYIAGVHEFAQMMIDKIREREVDS